MRVYPFKNLINFQDSGSYDYSEENVITYHYASKEGFNSIFKEEELIFTDFRFFEDESEYFYFLNSVDEALKQSRLIMNDYVYAYIDNWLKSNSNSFEKIRRYSKNQDGNYYVFCTTYNNDSIKMWKEYTKNQYGKGYNFGVSLKDFMDGLPGIGEIYFPPETADEFYFGKVIYDKKTQIKILYDFFKYMSWFFEHVIDGLGLDLHIHYSERLLSLGLEKSRLFFKDIKFEKENEFRYVIFVAKDEKFRPTISLHRFNIERSFINSKEKELIKVGFDSRKVIKGINESPFN